MTDQIAVAGVPAAVFVSPGRYVQGRGVIALLGDELRRVGSARPAVVCTRRAHDALAATLSTLRDVTIVHFGGDSTPDEIDRVGALVERSGADCVVGVGGGKVLDVARAVALPRDLKLIVSPTAASSDAATSSLSAIYGDEGEFLGGRFYRRNPDCVLVDTALIAQAPARSLSAGMGDGLATYYEARAVERCGALNVVGGVATQAALALARLCRELILEHGVAARRAAEAHAVTVSLERVVEANTLLSGLGFESAGVSAAHAFNNGLMELPPCRAYLHGERVAFGIVCQLSLEGAPEHELRDVVAFLDAVALPVTLGQLGIVDPSAKALEAVAARASAPEEIIHNEPFAVTAASALDALVAADAIGREHRHQGDRQ